ncbi:MAG: glycosyltransferase [Anaerolineales bacterium]|nr:glycosyltransferase [Anaerolineales bacterium]
MAEYRGRLGVVQRVLPAYRAGFFDLLAEHCRGGLGVFAGEPRPNEGIAQAESLAKAQWTSAGNLHILGGGLYLCWQRGLIDWLERWSPDALVVEANPRYLSTPAALRWMHGRKLPVLAWGLGAPPPRGRLAAWRSGRRRRFLDQFDGIIAYSQQGAQQYEALGIPAGKIFVAPNAASRRPANRPPQRPAAQPPAVLYVGRLQARKRLDALLRACAALPASLQPRLLIVGDGPERAALEALARRVYPQAEFRGALYGAALDAAFAEADLFVLPGTGGLALQQAMAHGLPVIAAEGDGSQADMVTPANGWLLRPGDEAHLQATLTAALADPALLPAMGAASFKLVQNTFNLENMVAGFVDAVQRVAN